MLSLVCTKTDWGNFRSCYHLKRPPPPLLLLLMTVGKLSSLGLQRLVFLLTFLFGRSIMGMVPEGVKQLDRAFMLAVDLDLAAWTLILMDFSHMMIQCSIS